MSIKDRPWVAFYPWAYSDYCQAMLVQETQNRNLCHEMHKKLTSPMISQVLFSTRAYPHSTEWESKAKKCAKRGKS